MNHTVENPRHLRSIGNYINYKNYLNAVTYHMLAYNTQENLLDVSACLLFGLFILHLILLSVGCLVFCVRVLSS